MCITAAIDVVNGHEFFGCFGASRTGTDVTAVSSEYEIFELFVALLLSLPALAAQGFVGNCATRLTQPSCLSVSS
jgi:hypothetical protein